MNTLKPLIVPAAAAALGARIGASVAGSIGDKPGSLQILAGEIGGVIAGLYLAKKVVK